MEKIYKINNPNDINNVPNRSTVIFNCKQCKKLVKLVLYKNSKRMLKRCKTLLCRNCFNKNNWIEKYGVDNPMKFQIIKDKNRNTQIVKYGGIGLSVKSNKDHFEKVMLDRYGGKTSFESPILKEKIEKINIEKFGSKSPFGNKEIQEKVRNITIKRYGVPYGMQSKEIKEKFEKSMLEKYGCKYSFQSKELTEKARQTNLERNGDRNYNNRKLTEKTMLDRYGGKTTLESPILREKKEKTCLKIYNNTKPYLFGSEEWISAMILKYGSDFKMELEFEKQKTCLKNYGVTSYFKSENFKTLIRTLRKLHPEWTELALDGQRKNNDGKLLFETDRFKESMKYLRKINPQLFQSKRIIYNNLSFDSIPELCVYIYCCKNGIPIYRNEWETSIKYTDIKGYEHDAYPDFIINGRFLEIKGKHFVKPDGTWYLPYRNDNMSDEQYSYLSSIYESKRIAYVNNNVIILYDNDPWVQMCINWVKSRLDVCSYFKSNPFNICYGFSPFTIDKNDEYSPLLDPIGYTPLDIINSEDKYCPVEGLGLSPFDI